MTVTHTDDVAAHTATAGHENRLVRLKYSTVAEVLADCRAANAAIGRGECPVCDWLEAHLGEDVIEAEAYVWGHPEWGASMLCETIRNTVRFNNQTTHPHGDLIAAEVQHDAALALAQHPWERARGEVERMLRHPDTRFVGPNGLYVVLAYFNAHHPNPRRFLEKPEVRPKLGGLEIARFAAPSFDGGRP